MKKSAVLVSIITAIFILTGCSGKVTRIDPNSTTDLSGEWNDTDSRLVAGEMIKDCLSRAWYGKYETSSKKPTVIVGKIKNRSHEHINIHTFINDMQRELINSGKVKFVADKHERTGVREERVDQEMMASEATKKRLGNETGAELMLIGSVNAIEDAIQKKRVMYYQVDLELVNIESNEKLWIGSKKIKKLITRKKYKL